MLDSKLNTDKIWSSSYANVTQQKTDSAQQCLLRNTSSTLNVDYYDVFSQRFFVHWTCTRRQKKKVK